MISARPIIIMGKKCQRRLLPALKLDLSVQSTKANADGIEDVDHYLSWCWQSYKESMEHILCKKWFTQVRSISQVYMHKLDFYRSFCTFQYFAQVHFEFTPEFSQVLSYKHKFPDMGDLWTSDAAWHLFYSRLTDQPGFWDIFWAGCIFLIRFNNTYIFCSTRGYFWTKQCVIVLNV